MDPRRCPPLPTKQDAKQGKGYAMRLVLDRILPVKHEAAVSTSHEADVEGLIEALSRAKAKMERRQETEVFPPAGG